MHISLSYNPVLLPAAVTLLISLLLQDVESDCHPTPTLRRDVQIQLKAWLQSLRDSPCLPGPIVVAECICSRIRFKRTRAAGEMEAAGSHSPLTASTVFSPAANKAALALTLCICQRPFPSRCMSVKPLYLNFPCGSGVPRLRHLASWLQAVESAPPAELHSPISAPPFTARHH
ncbi:unnamed protein product [Pleuronectes platessa]|uniref:Secreted protein n=1 Tax=Pleuronectes platessa TaxID=8262 RepID=A0A9N7VBP2_PLEPL|nr:unnamed protein product [Pleuronectes platessa]